MSDIVTPYYVLNRNEGKDVIHRNPREECNVDDAEDRQTVDPETAEALVTLNAATRCNHCYQEEPPT